MLLLQLYHFDILFYFCAKTATHTNTVPHHTVNCTTMHLTFDTERCMSSGMTFVACTYVTGYIFNFIYTYINTYSHKECINIIVNRETRATTVNGQKKGVNPSFVYVRIIVCHYYYYYYYYY